MGKLAREDDPNAKEETDTTGRGGALFRDTTLGLVVRLLTKDRFFQFPEERDPEQYIKKYGKRAQDEKKERVEKENRRSEEEWRQSNPRDAALENRNASESNTLAGSPDRNQDARDKGSNSDDEERNPEKTTHHDEERGNDVNLVGFEPNDPGGFLESVH